MLALILSLVSFLTGPLLFLAIRQRRAVYGFLDGFVLVGVAVLVLGDVLPEAIEKVGEDGWQVFLLAVAGFFLPFLLERQMAHFPISPGRFFQGLIVLGLIFHQVLDGLALNDLTPNRTTPFLQVAVVLHQLPKGFLLWSLARPAAGPRVAAALIAALCGSTVAGYFLAGTLSGLLQARLLWLFQAFIAGGLLHVILHHVPGERTDLSQRGASVWGGLGALTSLAALLLLHRTHEGAGPGAAPGGGFQESFAVLFQACAPSILLGLLAAGLAHAFLPRLLGDWFRGRPPASQVWRGMALAAPASMGACGAAPLFVCLMERGAPPGIAAAFLILSPEIGIDSLFLSWKLLGLQATLLRLALAFPLAAAAGLAIARLVRAHPGSGPAAPPDGGPAAGADPRRRPLQAILHGCGASVDAIGVWLLAGIGIAAFLAHAPAPSWIGAISGGWDVLIFSALGLPVYVSASGATPLAAELLRKGFSMGAVQVLLISGPATAVTSLAILKRTHGLRAAVLFAAAALAGPALCGLAVNWLLPGAVLPPPRIESGGVEPVEKLSAALLCALLALSVVRRGPRGFLQPLGVLFSGGAGLPSAAGAGWAHHHDHSGSHAHS